MADELIIEENVTITPVGGNLNFIFSENPGVNGDITINIQNSAEEAIDNMGIFLHTASTCGTWINPPDNPPATDYQDAIKWGSKTVRLGELVWAGGFRIYLDPVNNPTEYEWIKRDHGASWKSRIQLNPNANNPVGEVGRLGPGEISQVKIEYIAPPDIDSRRLYVRFEVSA